MHPESVESPAAPCRRVVLARGVVCDIELCPACNLFHVNVGAVSLRLQPTAVRDLAQTLCLALTEYQRAVSLLEAHEPAPPSPRSDGLH